jgi:hypothetical protein
VTEPLGIVLLLDQLNRVVGLDRPISIFASSANLLSSSITRQRYSSVSSLTQAMPLKSAARLPSNPYFSTLTSAAAAGEAASHAAVIRSVAIQPIVVKGSSRLGHRMMARIGGFNL